MKFTTAIFAAVLFMVQSASAVFHSSCDTIDILPRGIKDGRPYLYANCKKTDGSIRKTYLLLDHCLGNSNGKLIVAKDGYYSNSCTDTMHTAYAYDKANTYIRANCKNNAGAKNWIDIDTRFIENNNGFLTCLGYNGVEYL
ncbi:hypothetical protein BJ508DRAFT_305217 [Ascobolus immersus RN42]|uniref:Cyanovirin-N domain-containing protein n=1 Tax=Ascobolus immersus RN42 TaxID=1160509 RepID=A0A3N4IA24_ASCIM|nr:hypothetical protein BJ508DRAFT_305217 [Ascobolus immersus RN42]